MICSAYKVNTIEMLFQIHIFHQRKHLVHIFSHFPERSIISLHLLHAKTIVWGGATPWSLRRGCGL